MNRSQRHLPFLDALRGVAILTVFLYHSLGIAFGADKLGWKGLFRDIDAPAAFLGLYPLTYGWAGVAVFFVVSGFCIHLSHQQSKDKAWRSFITKRFYRIYPPYVLATVIFFFLWPWGGFSLRSMDRVTQLWTHLVAVHNLSVKTHYGINPALWSVAVEIQLYAIYPLLLFITRHRGWTIGLLIAGGIEVLIRLAESICWSFLDQPLPFFLLNSPFAYWFSWSIGAYLAQCYMDGRRSLFSKLRFDAAALVAFGFPLFKPTEPFSFLAFCVLAGIAIDRLASETWSLPDTKLLGVVWAHLGFLGIVSYSFYLFHQPILKLVPQAIAKIFPGTAFSPLANFGFCCAWYPVMLIIAFCVYRLIEKPSIAFGKLTARGQTWSSLQLTKNSAAAAR
jgi:peptidoglycan/LPS O-acetylase OafA/YrhL